MIVNLTTEQFKKLVPHISSFEFNKSLSSVGLKFIRIAESTHHKSDNHIVYTYSFEVINQKKFLMAKIKTGA
jgi:hypothetical protein